jgi:hypothetical protein
MKMPYRETSFWGYVSRKEGRAEMATLFMIGAMIFFSVWFLSLRQEAGLLQKRQLAAKTQIVRHTMAGRQAPARAYQHDVPMWKID